MGGVVATVNAAEFLGATDSDSIALIQMVNSAH
jgi:hypothetical protein